MALASSRASKGPKSPGLKPKAPKVKVAKPKVSKPKVSKPLKPKKPTKAKAPKPRREPRARSASGYSGSRRGGGKSVTHTCGHKQQHKIPGPKWKKERELVRLAGQICTTCWAIGRADELEFLCDIPNLTELSGTEPQVLWARSIRALLLNKVRQDAATLDRDCREAGVPPVGEAYLAVAVPAILKKTTSKFWIDNRESEALAELALSFDEIDALYAIGQAVKEAVANAPVCPF
jgi:hypothetical protein